MDKKTKIKETRSFVLMVLSAVVSAVGLWVFVYPSDFAPSGVDGIATMLQYLTNVNAGIFTFALNLPLLIAAWFILKKRYVIYTIAYTVLTSLLLLVLEAVDFYQYVTSTDRLIPAIFGGVAQGCTGLMLKIGASAGGVDVMACMVQKKMPHKNVESVIAFLSFVIVGVSYFVFWDLNSILLSAVEIFVCQKVTELILRDTRNAVEFKIVTDNPKEIGDEILYEMRKGATIVDGRGLFTEDGKTVIFCVVSYRQIPEFLSLVAKYEGTFVYYSDVMGVRGNFDWRKEDEGEEDIQKREEKLKGANKQ
ncbi:MAG: YitT family protein [Clostridia bacterium]|nr:YitT family protein [Clostridia bacterium]